MGAMNISGSNQASAMTSPHFRGLGTVTASIPASMSSRRLDPDGFQIHTSDHPKEEREDFPTDGSRGSGFASGASPPPPSAKTAYYDGITVTTIDSSSFMMPPSRHKGVSDAFDALTPLVERRLSVGGFHDDSGSEDAGSEGQTPSEEESPLLPDNTDAWNSPLGQSSFASPGVAREQRKGKLYEPEQGNGPDIDTSPCPNPAHSSCSVSVLLQAHTGVRALPGDVLHAASGSVHPTVIARQQDGTMARGMEARAATEHQQHGCTYGDSRPSFRIPSQAENSRSQSNLILDKGIYCALSEAPPAS